MNNKYVITNPNFPHIHKSHQHPQICQRSLSENRHIKIQFCPARSILTTTTNQPPTFYFYSTSSWRILRCERNFPRLSQQSVTAWQSSVRSAKQLTLSLRSWQNSSSWICGGSAATPMLSVAWEWLDGNAAFDAVTGRFERFLIKFNSSYR